MKKIYKTNFSKLTAVAKKFGRHKLVRTLGLKTIATIIITLTAISTFVAYAAFTEPTSAPGSSTQDFLQNILGANNADNAFNSGSVTSNNQGSIIERLQYISQQVNVPAEAVVKTGTAYGVGNNGSLTPASGAGSSLTATAGDVSTGKLFFGAGSSTWTPTTGTAILPTHNEWNGSAGASVADYTLYTKAKGGVDDYNNGGSMPGDTYTSGTWTDCSGGSFCGADSNANKQDPSTGLIWSNWMDSGNSHTWFWANNCYEPGDASNPGACAVNGDDACQCVKKSSSKVGCESFGDGNWRTPTQKELMQSYIDGSWGNLSNAGNTFWSSTTYSSGTHGGWLVYLYNGYTVSNNKTSTTKVRCVR